jgi:hypothetical protein
MCLWFQDEELGHGSEGKTVTLSQPFWEELKNHPIPVDTEVVRMLAHNPGCLDLYTCRSASSVNVNEQRYIGLRVINGMESLDITR